MELQEMIELDRRNERKFWAATIEEKSKNIFRTGLGKYIPNQPCTTY